MSPEALKRNSSPFYYTKLKQNLSILGAAILAVKL